jgi:ankyrin repeat protein
MAAEAVDAVVGGVDNDDLEGVARMLNEDPRLLSTVFQGETLLMRAAEGQSVGMVTMLLEKGAEVNFADSCGRTALFVAAIYGSDEMVSILLLSGADPSMRRDNGMTPLFAASRYGREAVVRVLLRHMRGRGVDERIAVGVTALWVACAAGHVEVVRALLLAGADHTIADDQGRTPLQIAELNRKRETFAIIEVRTSPLASDSGVSGISRTQELREIFCRTMCW